MTINQVRELLQQIRDDKTGEHRAVSYVVAEYLLDSLADFSYEYGETEDKPNEVVASWLNDFEDVVTYARHKLIGTPIEPQDGE